MVTKVFLIALLISAVAAQQLGFTFYGIGTEYFGESTAISGDVNGDGISDLVVGAPYSAVGGSGGGDDGIVYVLYGKTTSTSPFALTTDSNTLTGATGIVINGNYDSELGLSVAIGDVNNDGTGDIIMGAPDWYNNTGGEPGAVFVVFGSKTLPAVVNITNLDGTNGFGISGVASGDLFGTSVAAGDVNGDSITDIIIGAPDATGAASVSGCAYVFFGHTGTYPAFYYAGALGSNGITLNGAATDDSTGHSVAAGGDFNGDGIGDFLIGAPDAANGGNTAAGTTYAVFGSKTLGNPITLSALSGSNGFSFSGLNGDDYVGESVSIGDFNGDGTADIQAGAIGLNFYNGGVYVIYGSKSAFSATINLATLTGSNGFVIYDTDGTFGADEYFGCSVSCSSDVNNDGIKDLIIGAYDEYNDNSDDSGNAYVIFGSKSSFGANFNTSELDGTNGGVLFGVTGGDETGYSVASGGDLNNDGIGDFVVGSRSLESSGQTTSAGAVYVLFGQGASDIGTNGVFNLTTLLTGISSSISPRATTTGASASNSPHTTGSTTAGTTGTTTSSTTTGATTNGASSSPSPSPTGSAANAGPVMSLAALFFW